MAILTMAIAKWTMIYDFDHEHGKGMRTSLDTQYMLFKSFVVVKKWKVKSSVVG